MDVSLLKAHKFIVFGCDHYNPLGIVRSLGREGIMPIVVICGESTPYLVNNSKYCKEVYNFKTNEEGLGFIYNKYAHEVEKPFIITGADDTSETLDKSYDKLKDHFYFANEGKQGKLSLNNRKDAQCKIAEECGIRVPKGCVVKRGTLPTGLRYPVLTKVTQSTLGAWKKDVFICKNEEELKNAFRHIQAEEVLVQEFIEKKNELCIDGISINGGDEVFLSYTSEYIRFVNGEYGNYMWFKKFEDEEMISKIKNFVKKANYTGIFCFESLIGLDDEYYFLECNFRNSGWSYAHTYGGVNLPVMWSKAMLSGHIETSEAKFRNKPYTAMVEPSELLNSVFRTRQVNLTQWIKEVKTCDCYFYYDKNDNKPLISFVFHRIIEMIKNHLR